MTRAAVGARTWTAGLGRAATGWLRTLGAPESRGRLRAIQIGKSTLAAVLAWLVAGRVLGNEAAWLAPATAVLMVHSTVYRSVSEGIKRVVAVLVGVMIAATAGQLFGLSTIGLLLIVPLSLLGAGVRWIGAQGEYIATTAVLLLTFGVATNEDFLRSYVLDTAVGAVTGTAVNALLFPPAYHRTARAAISDLATATAGVLRAVAGGARAGWRGTDPAAWRRRADSLRGDAAWSALAWSKEGMRWNPWPRRDGPHQPQYYEPAVDSLWHIAIEVQRLTRILQDGAPDGEQVPEHLLAAVTPLQEQLAPLLEAVAEVIEAFGDDPAVREDGLSDQIVGSLERAEQLDRELSHQLLGTRLQDPARFAAAGSVLQVLHRILAQLRELDRRPPA